MIPRTVSLASPRHRWICYAAGLWALCFGAPHTWWALGEPFGFPGGPANHRLWMASWWRYLYDVVVILLSVLGAVGALRLVRPAGDSNRVRRIFRALSWIAAATLTLRAAAGMIVDGASDLVWWPAFLAGGLLFGSVAWLSREAPMSVAG